MGAFRIDFWRLEVDFWRLERYPSLSINLRKSYECLRAPKALRLSCTYGANHRKRVLCSSTTCESCFQPSAADGYVSANATTETNATETNVEAFSVDAVDTIVAASLVVVADLPLPW